jgi:chemosensory pili system protein ChpA (sensor histidine kinase/response regulator)
MDDRKKILVVDDSRILLKVISTKLSPHGFQVLTAEDGGEAISIVRQQRLDLILLDISFPPDVAHGGGVAWDGFLIMDWLRRMDEGKDVPIVILTGGDPAKLRERCFAAGAAALIQKPVEVDDLLTVIHQALVENRSVRTG